jgi:hypothetical protein
MLPRYHGNVHDKQFENVHAILFDYLTTGIDLEQVEPWLLRNPELKDAIRIQLKSILNAWEHQNWTMIEKWTLEYPTMDYWPIVTYIAYLVPIPTCWTRFLEKNGYPTMSLSQVLQSRTPFHHDSLMVNENNSKCRQCIAFKKSFKEKTRFCF